MEVVVGRVHTTTGHRSHKDNVGSSSPLLLDKAVGSATQSTCELTTGATHTGDVAGVI